MGTVIEDGQISREINREPLKMTEITITPMPLPSLTGREVGRNEL